MCLLDFNSRYWNGGLFTNSQKYFNATIRIPDALIFIGVQNNVAGQHVAVTEAAKMQVTLTWAQIRYWLVIHTRKGVPIHAIMHGVDA